MSLRWLYNTYKCEASPKEKELLWAGLYSNKIYFNAWGVTALLSAIAFLVNWLVASMVEHSTSDLSRWETPEVYIFASTVLVQAAYNMAMVMTVHRNTNQNHWVENVAVGAILWGAVVTSLLQWYLAWQLRLDSAVKWVLHALNFVFLFHALWWDALFWWWTWVRARGSEATHMQTLQLAERETLTIVTLEASDSGMEEKLRALKSKHARGANPFEAKDSNNNNNNENLFLFSPLFKESPTFDSLSYYPYFPHYFTSYANNNYYYP